MPLARDLHPEFGYVGSAPRLCRKLGLGLAFVAFGLVAARAACLYSWQLRTRIPCRPWRLLRQKTVGAKMSNKINRIPDASEQMRAWHAKRLRAKDQQVGGVGQDSGNQAVLSDTGAEQPVACKFIRRMKAHPAQALNERPAIAAVPIGRRDEPAILPSAEPPVSVAAIPQPDEVFGDARDAPEIAAAPSRIARDQEGARKVPAFPATGSVCSLPRLRPSILHASNRRLRWGILS